MARYWSANRRYIRRYHPRRRRVAGSGFVNKAGPFFVSAEALQVALPFAPNKYWAFPILVRMYRKRQTNQLAPGKGGKLERKQTGQATAKQYRTRPELALEMIQIVASWIPHRMLRVLSDSEYAGQTINRHLPANAKLISRMNMKAALF